MIRHRWLVTIAAVVGFVFLGAADSRAAAQSGAVTGTVYRDTADHVLNGVEVSIEAVGRSTVTNYAGEFRLTGLPAGRYAIMLRHLGFAPLIDTVVVAENAPVDREYVMAEQAVALDSVRITATETRHVSSRYDEFLGRLKDHNGGYFVDAATLRKNDSRKLQDLLTSRVPGVRTYRPDPVNQPTWEYLSSGRGACNGPAFTCGGGAGACPVTLYVDGIPVYSSGAGVGNIPDLSTYNTNDYAGVEYYASGATLPSRYNGTTNACGVLLLWSKESLPPSGR